MLSFIQQQQFQIIISPLNQWFVIELCIVNVFFKSEHKIQSSQGPLTLQFQPVPKMLKLLCSEWTPKAYVVTFKVSFEIININIILVGN
jgi:hypothetical protein